MQSRHPGSGQLAAVMACALASGCWAKHVAPAAVQNQPAATTALETRVANRDVLAYLPVDMDVVGSVDAEGLRASAIWAKYLEPGLEGDSALTRFEQTCGFDPTMTITRISFALTTTNGTAGGAVVLRGLDRERTLACAARPHPGPKTSVDRGVIDWVDDDQHWLIGFADARTAVMYSSTSLARAQLDAVLASGAPLRGSAAFGELFASVDTSATAWVLVNGRAHAFDALASVAPRPSGVVGAVTLAAGLAIKVRARMASPADAATVTTMLQTYAASVRSMVSRLDVAVEDSDATLVVEATPDQLGALAGMMGGVFGGGSGTP